MRDRTTGLLVAVILSALTWWLPAASAPALDTNVVISEDRTVTTSPVDPAPLTVTVIDREHPDLVLGPAPIVVVDEAGLFDLTIIATSASGGITLTGTGLPGGTFAPEYGRWTWYTSYSDAGTYAATITASDAGGHQVTIPISVRVRNVWKDDIEQVFLTPVASPVQAAPVPIVRGSWAFTLDGRNSYGDLMPPSDVTYQYLLDDQPIGAPAIGVVETILDFSQVPDGTHALSLALIDGAGLDRYNRMPIEVVVDNVPGPVTGAQRVPFVGMAGFEGHFDPPAIDWVTYPGERSHANARPLAYRRSDPATTLSDPGDLLDSHQWFAEPLNQPISGLHWGNATFYRNIRGDVVSAAFYAQAHSTSEGTFERAERHDDFDGPRDDNGVSPYSTFVPDPAGPGWYCVELSGAVRRIELDGTVTTIVGHQRRRDLTPYDFRDATIPIAAVHADTETLLGSFAGGIELRMPVDLAFDPRDASHRTIYVADTGNHRIAKVDFGGSAPVITTVAGVPRVSGYRDGASGQALFSSPYSIAFAADGSLCIADMANCAIRKLSADGLAVTTIAGGALAPTVPSQETVGAAPDAYLADGTVSQATVNYPQVLRLDSHGDIVFGEHLTGSVRRVDLARGRIGKIAILPARSPGWLWLDVDRRGNVGPRDDVLVTMGTGDGNTEVSRISADGSRIGQLFSGDISSYNSGQVSGLSESAGHYPWAIAIDDEEARLITTGFGTSGLVSFRRFLSGDVPFTDDWANHQRGGTVWRTGTVPGFPYGCRPGFTILRGPTGNCRLGVLPNFDELGDWSDADLTTYIHDGMGGSVPRPEITGNDLNALIWYIRRYSMRGNAEIIPVPASDPDTTAPTIGAIQITQVDAATARVRWQTDEPTFGVVQWGLSDRHHAWSDLESGHGTSHSVLMRRLPSAKPIHIAVRAKDIAGNQTVTADTTFVLDPLFSGGGGSPGTTISGIATSGVTTTAVTIGWDTDAPATSQIEFGFNAFYGQRTVADPTLVTHHAVTLTGLVPGTTYHYRTISSNQAVPSVDVQAPTVPTAVALDQPSATTLRLTWRASSDDVGVAGYRIDVARDTGFSSPVAGYTDVDVGDVTNRTLSGLAPGTGYYARVRSYDAAANRSAWSAAAWAVTTASGGTAGSGGGHGGGGSGYGSGGGRSCGMGSMLSGLGLLLAFAFRGRRRDGE